VCVPCIVHHFIFVYSFYMNTVNIFINFIEYSFEGCSVS
jgi:hypothetical protein